MQIEFDPKKGIWASDPEIVDKLSKNCFGRHKGNIVLLDIEEALYMMSFQNTRCVSEGKEMGFNELVSYFPGNRLFIRFNTFRDWRDRGLVMVRSDYVKRKGNAKKSVVYPAKAVEIPKLDATAQWDSESLFSIMEDENAGKTLFNGYWFGQFGIYKQDRGHLLKLNFLETIFLAKHAGIRIVDPKGKAISHTKILGEITRIREYAQQLYEVYEGWRLSGFVVKTGFKFGSHFRIYFPGASPTKGGDWVHSKHVLHVFPKEQRMLISEWARIVRVAHSVRKTFILALPKLSDRDHVSYPAEFIAYRRKKQNGQLVRETIDDEPRYLVAAVSEDEHIGGIELASLLKDAESRGVELLLSITDRESSVTYYLLKRISMPGSEYEHYEIEWHKP